MKSRLVRIGNSQGIRIPKPLLEQTRLGEQVEIRVEDDHLVISAAEPGTLPPRADWAETFQEMATAGDDALLDGDVLLPTQWEGEWQW